LGTERGKLLTEEESLPVEHFLLSQARTRGFGSVSEGRDPELAARENRDKDREEPGKKAERQDRGTAAPAGEDVQGAREHGEAPGNERPVHGVRVELGRSQAHRRLDRDSRDFENGVRRDEQYRERQGELFFAKDSRGEKTGAEHKRDLREPRGQRAEIDGARKTRSQHAAREPERQAREHQS